MAQYLLDSLAVFASDQTANGWASLTSVNAFQKILRAFKIFFQTRHASTRSLQFSGHHKLGNSSTITGREAKDFANAFIDFFFDYFAHGLVLALHQHLRQAERAAMPKVFPDPIVSQG
jgi:hypothetical protein